MTKYFKVLHRWDSGELQSACMNPSFDLHVTYTEDTWVKPELPGSKLLVFNNLVAARGFLATYQWQNTHEVWRVKVKNPVKMTQLAYIRDDEVKDFWRKVNEARRAHKRFDPNKALTISERINAPHHTYGVSELKLVERV